MQIAAKQLDVVYGTIISIEKQKKDFIIQFVHENSEIL